MTERLAAELERVAEHAPRVVPAPETWRRGRRAHRYDVLAGALAGLVLVASLGGLVAGITATADREPTPAGPGSAPVLPSTLHTVPERLQQYLESGSRWDPRVAEDDLAVGRVSVAFATGEVGLGAVLVTAADGRYHLVELPGYSMRDPGLAMLSADQGAGLALSPDGRLLAHAVGGPAPGREDYATVRTGIRVVDLTTGETRTEVDLTPVSGDAQATIAQRLLFSADGRWLAWSGRRYQQLNGSGSSSRGPAVGGRIALSPSSGTTRDRLPRRMAEQVLGVDDEGRVVGLDRGRLAVWDGAGTRLVPARDLALDSSTAGSVSPDGRRLVLDAPAGSRTVPVVDLASGRVLRPALPRSAGRARATTVGWVGPGRFLVQAIGTTGSAGAGWVDGDPELVMVRPRGGGTVRVSGWERDDAMPPPSRVLVGVDLVDPADPSGDLPAPEWPWSDTRRVVTGVLAALALVSALLLGRRLLRRRRA